MRTSNGPSAETDFFPPRITNVVKFVEKAPESPIFQRIEGCALACQTTIRVPGLQKSPAFPLLGLRAELQQWA